MQKVILPAIRRSRGLFTDYQQVRQDRASSCQTRPEPECLSAVRLYRYGHTQKGRSNELFAERVSFKIICWRKPPPVRALIANRIKTGVPAVRKDPVSADTSATRFKTGPSTNCREPTHAVNIRAIKLYGRQVGLYEHQFEGAITDNSILLALLQQQLSTVQLEKPHLHPPREPFGLVSKITTAATPWMPSHSVGKHNP